MCIYIYKYIYIYMYIYIYVYTYTYVYIYIHTNISIYMYIYTHKYLFICIYLYTFKSYIYIWFSISCVGKGILPLLRLNPFPGSASASTVLPFGLQHSSHLGPWWRRYPRLGVGAWSLRDPVQENPAPRENITNRNQWKRKCHPT